MRWVRGFLKESGATGYAQGGERCYGSLDNGVQNLLPGDFLWIVHRDICFKGFVFFCHSGQRRGICGHKNDCIQMHSDSSLCSEQQFYFRKADLYRNTDLLQSNRFISERQNTIRLQKPGKFRRFLPSCHPVRKPLPSSPQCFSPLSGL